VIGVFRAHVLIANELVTGGKLDGTFAGMTKSSQPVVYLGGNKFRTDNNLWYGGSVAFEVVQDFTVSDTQVQVAVSVTAHRNIWIQEPDLLFQVNGYNDTLSYIEGYYNASDGIHYTEDQYPSLNLDASSMTVHYDQITQAFVTNPWLKWKWIGGSSDAFRSLYDQGTGMPDSVWSGARILGGTNVVAGKFTTSTSSSVKRWETAGLAPNWCNVHLVGWNGGAGAVVCQNGYADTKHCGSIRSTASTARIRGAGS
jgi:hypothetical protein